MGQRRGPAHDAGTAGKRRAGVAFEDQVFPQRQVADDTHRMAVFGDSCHAGIDPGAWPRRQAAAVDQRLPAVQAALATQHFSQQLLAVARHTGDRNDFAGAHLQRRHLERRAFSAAAHQRRTRRRTQRRRVARLGMAHLPAGQFADLRAAQFTDHRSRRARVAHRRGDITPDHQRGEFGLGRTGRGQGRNEATGAQYGDAVGHAQHFVELVADEDDRQAGSDHLAQGVEQRLAFLRRQHRRRFVEDQDARAGLAAKCKQRFEDLDPLALADTQVADQGVGVDLQAEALRRVEQLRASRRAARKRLPQTLGAEHHVVEHGQVVGQREMLVHHADARGQRGLRLARRQRLAVDLDAAGVGNVMPEQDRYQGAFAGAVFTEQREHLAGREVERDIVVGEQRAKALADMLQAQGGELGFHGMARVGSIAYRQRPEWPPETTR